MREGLEGGYNPESAESRNKELLAEQVIQKGNIRAHREGSLSYYMLTQDVKGIIEEDAVGSAQDPRIHKQPHDAGYMGYHAIKPEGGKSLKSPQDYVALFDQAVGYAQEQIDQAPPDKYTANSLQEEQPDLELVGAVELAEIDPKNLHYVTEYLSDRNLKVRDLDPDRAFQLYNRKFGNSGNTRESWKETISLYGKSLEGFGWTALGRGDTKTAKQVVEKLEQYNVNPDSVAELRKMVEEREGE